MGPTLLVLSSLLAGAVHSEVYMKPKKAFIFGGNGQIGAAVVQVTIATVYFTRPYMLM